MVPANQIDGKGMKPCLLRSIAPAHWIQLALRCKTTTIQSIQGLAKTRKKLRKGQQKRCDVSHVTSYRPSEQRHNAHVRCGIDV